MDDNLSCDDEVTDSPLSPNLSGKKIKLNDGSSQESLNNKASSSKNEKDDIVDSGLSADKSESTSSDDRGTEATSGPSNEVVNVGPSGSNIRTILLNIRRPKRGRNYRKRKTPDRDSDSNESSRDSDDLSTDDNVQPTRGVENPSEGDDIEAIITTLSEGLPSASSNSSNTDYSVDSDAVERLQTDDSGSDDDDLWSRFNADYEEANRSPPPVLLKKPPKHNYSILREVINREMGLTFPEGKAVQTSVIFEQNFCGSLHAVYRLKKLHNLNKHNGCVNSINFHPEGHLLASGSDDMNVIVWDWARKTALKTIKTGHKSNVFQSKFLYLNARSQLNIVTCARDGQVRLVQCSPSGGSSGAGVARRKLASHSRAAHKLHVSPSEPHVVLSAGEDGLVIQCDVRTDRPNRLLQVKEGDLTIPLYSVAGHPRANELLLAGRDRYVRTYDRRHTARPLHYYCPQNLADRLDKSKKKTRRSMMHLTCAVYNHDGTEILGSYNDDEIYLFDTKLDVYDKDDINPERVGFQHRYGGHRNSATFKGVAFFGPHSEFVVSGSDCAHVYVWDKRTEAIVQWLRGDRQGVVNCIETHPRFPVLATSGLDKDIKIWIPKSDSDPDFEGIEEVLRENAVCQRSPLFNDFLPTLYNAWNREDIQFPDDEGSNIEFNANTCTVF